MQVLLFEVDSQEFQTFKNMGATLKGNKYILPLRVASVRRDVNISMSELFFLKVYPSFNLCGPKILWAATKKCNLLTFVNKVI